MIDGTRRRADSPAVVVIRGDRIEAVGSASHDSRRCARHRSGGATLLPGLIDLHTHLTSTGVHWEDELLKTTPGQAALHGAHNALRHADGRLHDLPRHGADLAVHRHRPAQGDRRRRRARSAAAGVGQLRLADRRRRRRAAVLDLRRRADRAGTSPTAPTRSARPCART